MAGARDQEVLGLDIPVDDLEILESTEGEELEKCQRYGRRGKWKGTRHFGAHETNLILAERLVAGVCVVHATPEASIAHVLRSQ